MKKVVISLLCLISGVSMAQNPGVGKSSTEPVVFYNAHIFIGNGTEHTSGSLVMEKGLIKEVSASDLSSKYPSAKKVDVKGKHLYPGLISPANTLGLAEIESSRPTLDHQELGDYNPNVRALIAYNTDSEVIPTVRGNGVLITQAAPTGGIISGRSSIFNLDGWNWEDAVLKADDGLWLNWPRRMTFGFNMETFTREPRKNERYQKSIDELRQMFTESNAQKVGGQPHDNLKLAAMQGILNGDQRLYIEAGSDKEVIEALAFCKEVGVKYPVVVGAVTSEIAIQTLKENNVPIIVSPTHRLPSRTDSDVWEAYKLPAMLLKKGLTVGLHYNDSYWRTRNIAFVAGNTVAHGLTKAEALSLITANNAKILGIDKWVGTLEAGKHATFVISEGDIMDMRTAKVTDAYIRGAAVDLDDKQKRLANKYFDKYGIEK
jgi:imidazolonepropionase-like amidohydrolase